MGKELLKLEPLIYPSVKSLSFQHAKLNMLRVNLDLVYTSILALDTLSSQSMITMTLTIYYII
jgi:hypothetical protein